MREGWTGEDEAPPVLPMAGFAGFLASVKADPGAGRTVAEVLDAPARRSWWEDNAEPERRDPDETAAALRARGYVPGMASQLAMQYADVMAELEAERAKLEHGTRRQALAAREHAAGRAGAWQVQQMLDGDFGDPHRAGQLERQAARLRERLADAQRMIAPGPQPEREPDPLEAATRRAHQAFTEATHARMAAAEAGQSWRQQARRPFGYASRGYAGDAEPDCPECIAAGATAEESFLIHADPDPLPVPAGWTPDGDAGRHGRHGREVTR